MADENQPANAQVDTKIQVKDAPAQVDLTGGVENGVVEKDLAATETDPQKKEQLLRVTYQEKVVHDKDADGNVIGFHKELVESEENAATLAAEAEEQSKAFAANPEAQAAAKVTADAIAAEQGGK